MAETSTFSAAVEEVYTRAKRKDRLQDVIAYLRTTLRECQVLAFFEQDLLEDQLVVTTLPHTWQRPINLRTILAAKPNEKFSRRNEDVWFKNKPPGSKTKNLPYYLYLSGDTYIFTGTDLTVGDAINIAYFTYSRRFTYYETSTRPATYDPETETWSYLTAYDVDDTTRENARNLVSNWLLFHWFEVIVEGALAKLYKVVNDDRQRASFALYKQFQKDLLSGERVVYLSDFPDLNG